MKYAAIFLIFIILLMASDIKAATVTRSPIRQEILKDSKPATLSVIDQLYLRRETIRVGAGKVNVLVNMLTNQVEYVWSFNYRRYVRPKFVMPDAQKSYDRYKNSINRITK